MRLRSGLYSLLNTVPRIIILLSHNIPEKGLLLFNLFHLLLIRFERSEEILMCHRGIRIRTWKQLRDLVDFPAFSVSSFFYAERSYRDMGKDSPHATREHRHWPFLLRDPRQIQMPVIRNLHPLMRTPMNKLGHITVIRPKRFTMKGSHMVLVEVAVVRDFPIRPHKRLATHKHTIS